jgi:hypothetical protein
LINVGPDALQRALDAVAGVPAGQHGRFDVGVTTSGAQLTYGQRLNSVWQTGVWAAADWQGHYSAGARLQAAW